MHQTNINYFTSEKTKESNFVKNTISQLRKIV